MAEIRERAVTQFKAIEFLIYVDGSMLESQMFHGARVEEFPAAIAKCIAQFVEEGSTESSPDKPSQTERD